ncbi:hypothetical protein HOH11_01905 [Candidatus Woesearchaeota archaeon]|jgi:hypothetical protein|nr:hypothetical protein [Candidatus Woesearchaeota archaeon]MBT6023334.1 hypothetical protein [Candidatus Woesearchaeota archaeon]
MGLRPGTYDSRQLNKKQHKLLSEARRSFRNIALTDFGYINSNGKGGRAQLYTKKRIGWFKTESEFVGDLIFSESKDDLVIACAFYTTEKRPFVSRRLHGAIRDLRATVEYKGLDEKLGKKIIVGSETIEKN